MKTTILMILVAILTLGACKKTTTTPADVAAADSPNKTLNFKVHYNSNVAGAANTSITYSFQDTVQRTTKFYLVNKTRGKSFDTSFSVSVPKDMIFQYKIDLHVASSGSQYAGGYVKVNDIVLVKEDNSGTVTKSGFLRSSEY